ncbi:MAG TPA: phosphotransferase [Gemmatimonadales bacterium]|jgi:aminoglycoside phosphotransferase (APT) family kinase protein
MRTPYAEKDARVVIAGFAAVFDREEFRHELERLALGPWRWGRPLELRVQPLKAHLARCTFELGVRTESGWHTVIGKVHTTDRSDIFRVMTAVRAAGFGTDSEFSIPEPLAFLPTLQLLLEERVQGSAAKEVFLGGGPLEQLAAAERGARWLARFHATAPRLGQTAEPEALLERARHWADRIATFEGSLAAKAAQLLRRLEDARAGAGIDGFRAGHGSYMPEHVLLSHGRTAVLDLDECDVADPSRDVAWFVVSVQRLALTQLGSLKALDGVVRQFVDTYKESSEPGAARHLTFYRMLECLHRARRDLFKRIPPVPEWAELMLDEGLRVA